ncbi:MAG: uroporphyrinogen decarboxylase family protein [Armatimonadota bacterium]
MTALERVQATLAGTHRDRLANQPLLMSFAVAYHGVPYWEYVSDYRVLVAAQLRAAEDFGVDVVTCCSDAWREASDLGAELTYYDHEPPGCTRPLLTERADLVKLQPVEPEAGPRMIDRILAVSDLADALRGQVEVDGWVEGPVSQATNLRGLTDFMLDTKDDPGFVDDLMDWVTDLEIAFARAQIRAGADVVGVGDAASSLLPPAFYEAHVVPRIQRLVAAIHDGGALVRLHVCGDTTHLLPYFADLHADIIEIDSLVDLAAARQRLGADVTLLGNLNPVAAVQDGSPDTIVEGLRACYEVTGPRYIVGAGCEIPAATPPQNLMALAEFARSVS